jgi:hypothetical protein
LVVEATAVEEGSIGSNFDEGSSGAERASADVSASSLEPQRLVGFHQARRGRCELQPGIVATATIVRAKKSDFDSIA